jgi:hypothetical protein
MQELKTILMELMKIQGDAGLSGVSPDTTFDCAVRIYNAEKMNNSKKPLLATEKQIKEMKRLKITPIPDNITKSEAFQLIREKRKDE